MKQHFSINPQQLFLTVAAVYLGIQGINIAVNALGVDIPVITNLLDLVLNNTVVLLGVLFVATLAVYFFQQTRRK